MSSTRYQLTNDLQDLGIHEGGILLVHASMRSLGQVEGGAETVIQALLNVLGDDGTLLFPSLSYQTVTPQSPHFDVQTTPVAKDLGILPEYFRKRKATLRSLHPTHSVCGIGRLAQDILQDHQKDTTPCGIHSPFHKLRHYHNSQILFLGCGLRPNTSIHAIEELVEPPYLYGDVIDYDVVDENNKAFKMPVRSHNFRGWIQRYDRIQDVMNQENIQTGKVLDANCHLVDVEPMWSAVHTKLKDDALFFVDRDTSEFG